MSYDEDATNYIVPIAGVYEITATGFNGFLRKGTIIGTKTIVNPNRKWWCPWRPKTITENIMKWEEIE